MEIQKKNTINKRKWIYVWIIISLISFIILSLQNNNSDNDIKEITITQRTDIGNTDSIKKLQEELYEKHKVKLNIVVVDNLITSDYYSEALRVFKTYYNSEPNSMLMYIAIRDRKIALRTGDNIRDTYTKSVCNKCVTLCQDYFRQNKYN